MKKLLFVLLLVPVTLLAQNRFNISGTVTDENGEAVAFANVILNKNNKYAVADEGGRYQIRNVRRGEYLITISSLGFETMTQNITVNQDLGLDFTLIENVQNLDDVTVEGKKTSTRQEERAITIGSFELADVVSQTNILADEIDKISGVRIRRSGSLGDGADVAINGLNGTAVRQFIDGVPLEFLFPGTDIATLPLTGLKRVDVYKGVLPVDIASDALGGGINIITEENTVNRLQTSYSVGSFNTHIADFSLNLTDGKESYVKVSAGINYSDNDYTFEAPIRLRDPRSLGAATPQFIDLEEPLNVKRFHDIYRLQYSTATIGTYNKKWTDHAEIAYNYFNNFRQLNNNLSGITNIAIGEGFSDRENSAVVIKYDKTLIKDKLKLKTISNYSDLLTKFTDTTSNTYNWLGDIITPSGSRGEFVDGDPIFTETKTRSYVNRTTLDFQINDKSKLTFSNIFANQRQEIKEFDIDNPKEFNVLPEQKITKDVAGLQYNNSIFNEKVELSAALKYYTYKLVGFSRFTQTAIEDTEGFLGWNGGLKYQISDAFSIRGSYERGFLIPTVAQFAGDGVNIDANGELQPEESDNYNFGFRYSERFNEDYRLTWTTNGFLREQRNFIFLDADATRQFFTNVGDITSQGFETEVQFNFLRNFNWNTNISYVERIIQEFMLDDSGELEGSQLPNNPVFFYNTELAWNTDDIFNSGIGVRLYGLFTYVDEFNIRPVPDGANGETNPNDFVPEQNRLDLGVALNFLERKITASFNVVNVTDEDLFDNFSIPRPGRNFNFKLIYELSNF
ncbi:MAG: TonB-dependent receptor [Bacteroidota bacterium]